MDSGAGTLRQAIVKAEAPPGRDVEESVEDAAGREEPASRVSKQAWLVALSAGLGYMFDAYVVNLFSFVLPLVKAEFALSTTGTGAIGSALLAGYFIGTVGFGWAADRWGRRDTLGVSIFVYGLTTGATGLAPNAAVFGALRFLTGIGGAGELSVGVPYTAEVWPRLRRAFGTGGVIFSLYAVGALLAILAALVLAPTAGWRWVFYVAILPALLTFALRRLVKESGAFEDAVEQSDGQPTGGFREVLTSPALRRPLVVSSLIFIANAVGYWGFLVFLQEYMLSTFKLSFGESLAYTAIPYAAMVVWPFAGALFADRFGRRPAGVIGGVAIAVANVIAFSTDSLAFFIVAEVFGIGLLGWTWAVGQTYVSELFPTRLRATGFGVSVAIGRFPAIAGPLLTGTLISSIGLGGVAKWFALLWVLYIVGFLLGPETARRSLAELDRSAEQAP